jgi:hypothetical protein
MEYNVKILQMLQMLQLLQILIIFQILQSFNITTIDLIYYKFKFFYSLSYSIVSMLSSLSKTTLSNLI